MGTRRRKVKGFKKVDGVSIQIDIEYMTKGTDVKHSPITKIHRVARVDGKEVYNEIGDFEIHNSFIQHPIRQLELFLLGLEKSANLMKDRVTDIFQSSEASILRNRQQHHLQSLDFQGLYNELYRILQDVPGCKLHPSSLAIESIGDLSCLPQESQAHVHTLLQEYRARTSIK